MEQNVNQINSGIMTNADVSIKKVMYVGKIVFEIMLHVTKNKKYLADIMDDSVITCVSSC